MSKINNRRSPIVQGGLEILYNGQGHKNNEILRKYLEMLHAFYIDPSLDKKVIVGSFLTSTHGNGEPFKVGNVPEKR